MDGQARHWTSEKSPGPRRNCVKAAINYASSNHPLPFHILSSPPCSPQTSNTSPAHTPPPPGKESPRTKEVPPGFPLFVWDIITFYPVAAALGLVRHLCDTRGKGLAGLAIDLCLPLAAVRDLVIDGESSSLIHKYRSLRAFFIAIDSSSRRARLQFNSPSSTPVSPLTGLRHIRGKGKKKREGPIWCCF